MSDVTQAQTPTVEQALNKTDLGHIIYENRKLLFSTIIAILVGVTGYFVWRQSKQSAALENSVKVFEFQNKIWKEAKAGKVAPTELISAFEKLEGEVQTAPVMLPVVLEIGKFLYDKGSYAEAETLLRKVEGSVKHSVSAFFVGFQLYVVLEKLNKVDEAIAVLEKLAQTKDILVPAKVSLELGRLYLTKGEKGKAQTQFDHILATYPNDDQAKLAKLYLAKLAQ